jgi:hypothetical protein
MNEIGHNNSVQTSDCNDLKIKDSTAYALFKIEGITKFSSIRDPKLTGPL